MIRIHDWGRAFDRLLNLLAFVAGGILVLGTLSVTLDVFLRYLFASPLRWVTEYTEYGLLYVTFLGTGWVLRNDGHVKVDVFTWWLPSRAQAGLEVIAAVIGLAVSLVLLIYGIEVSWDHYQRGVFNPTVLQTPMAPILAVIPFGGAILAIQFIRRGLFHLHRLRKSTAHNGG